MCSSDLGERKKESQMGGKERGRRRKREKSEAVCERASLRVCARASETGLSAWGVLTGGSLLPQAELSLHESLPGTGVLLGDIKG